MTSEKSLEAKLREKLAETCFGGMSRQELLRLVEEAEHRQLVKPEISKLSKAIKDSRHD